MYQALEAIGDFKWAGQWYCRNTIMGSDKLPLQYPKWNSWSLLHSVIRLLQGPVVFIFISWAVVFGLAIFNYFCSLWFGSSWIILEQLNIAIITELFLIRTYFLLHTIITWSCFITCFPYLLKKLFEGIVRSFYQKDGNNFFFVITIYQA